MYLDYMIQMRNSREEANKKQKCLVLCEMIGYTFSK